jgi:hypothetical protein
MLNGYERTGSLRKAIMMSMKGVRYDENFIGSVSEFWDALEDRKNKGDATNIEEKTKLCANRNDFRGIGELPKNEVLKLYYEDQLRLTNGNVKRAAEKARIKYSTYRSSLIREGVAFGRKLDRSKGK